MDKCMMKNAEANCQGHNLELAVFLIMKSLDCICFKYVKTYISVNIVYMHFPNQLVADDRCNT